MGDMGEIWRDTKEVRKEASQNRKEHNRDCSTQLLRVKGFGVKSKNGGIHLVVTHNDKTADMWPSTGKWNIRGTSKYRRGVKQLIKALENE